MKYVIALLVLSILIIVHEFGHFIIAKASGVTVTEFSLGMGPRLLKFTKNGTMYSIKLFLFGGSCRMLGEDEENDAEGSFNSKSVWKRIAIVFGGPLFNFIFAFICAVILIAKIGYDPCVVYSVDADSPAETAGLMAGDKITKINNTNVTFYGDYSLYLLENEDAVMELTYERDGNTYTTTLTPEYIDKDVYQMGVYMNADSPTISSVSEDTPAYEAGLKEGDLILAIDGKQVTASEEVSPIVQACGGNAITLTIERDGEEMNLSFVPEMVHSTYYYRGVYMSNIRISTNPH